MKGFKKLQVCLVPVLGLIVVIKPCAKVFSSAKSWRRGLHIINGEESSARVSSLSLRDSFSAPERFIAAGRLTGLSLVPARKESRV